METQTHAYKNFNITLTQRQRDFLVEVQNQKKHTVISKSVNTHQTFPEVLEQISSEIDGLPSQLLTKDFRRHGPKKYSVQS